jgi:hypothetical protein
MSLGCTNLLGDDDTGAVVIDDSNPEISPAPLPYEKASKLDGEFEVVENPADGIAGAGNIFYDPATKKLYAGIDDAVTLDTTADAALISELDVIFHAAKGVKVGDFVSYEAGIPVLAILIDEVTLEQVAALLAKIDVSPEDADVEIESGKTLTIPPERRLDLTHGSRIILKGNDTGGDTASKLVTGGLGPLGASGRGNITYKDDADLDIGCETEDEILIVEGDSVELESRGFINISTTGETFKRLINEGTGDITISDCVISAETTLQSEY